MAEKKGLRGLFQKKKSPDFAVAKKYYAKGYSDAAASITKRSLKGFLANSGSVIEDIDFNNKTLRQRGRMLYMASPVAASAINTNRTKIVGTGLQMRCSINRSVLGISEESVREWQRHTEAEWAMWAESREACDALGLNNFYELQQIAIKSWLMSGDVFALFKRADSNQWNPYTLRLQLVEADRVSTPSECKGFLSLGTEGKTQDGNKIHDGVEVDKNGKIVAYHVCNVYPNQTTVEKAEWTRVKARGDLSGIPNIIHVMDAERPDQYRGVTYLAPIVEVLLQLRRYTESELIAALVQSYLTAWITTASDPTDFPFNEVGAGDVDGVPGDQPSNISSSENEYEMGPGTINHLAPGETVTLGNPNIPTAGFSDFVKSIVSMAGAGIEIPYEVLIKQFGSSYSASKGALEEAWEFFKMGRSWFVADFCRPVYEAWLAEAVAIGRIKAPGFFDDPLIRRAWSGSRWDGPAQTHLNPVQEASANETIARNGWKTNEQIAREYYGGSYEENIEKLAQEREMFERAFPAATDPKGE